ncbi:hypothetical protein [Arthrobacter sp. UYEF36]|uniref:hypothetical protein n=1 Tax=Arthrobacter sp. UYEF36 TaxID=1756366 RepID=UPI0033979E6D
MTGTREPQQEGPIQAMLRDAGLESSTELRRSLEQLGALVPDRAPAPRADLAALLAAGSDDSLPAGVASLAGRRGRKRRLAIVGGAVLGAMTLGAGAVAASSEVFRENISHTVGTIFQPSGQTPDTAPKPAGPSPADLPAAPVPSNATGATTPPRPEAPEPPTSAAAVPAKPGAAATPPAVGRGGVLPTPPQRPVTPGTPRLPDPSEKRGLSAAPLPTPSLPGQP